MVAARCAAVRCAAARGARGSGRPGARRQRPEGRPGRRRRTLHALRQARAPPHSCRRLYRWCGEDLAQRLLRTPPAAQVRAAPTPGRCGRGSRGSGPSRARRPHCGAVVACSASSATAAWRGKKPLPRAVFCWFAVMPCSESVTQPAGRPMSHSTNSGAGRGPFSSFRIAGAGATRPVMCSHRAMAGAYRPQR